MHALSNSGNIQVKSEPINVETIRLHIQYVHSFRDILVYHIGFLRSSLSAPVANHGVPSFRTHSNIFMMSQEPKSESGG